MGRQRRGKRDRRDSQAIGPSGARTVGAVEELRIVGGKITREGQELASAAAATGLNVLWLDFDSGEAQAAIAGQAPGAVRLPLVIVGGRYTLQRPRSNAGRACVSALRAGDRTLPAGAVALGPNRSG